MSQGSQKILKGAIELLQRELKGIFFDFLVFKIDRILILLVFLVLF